MVEPAIHTLMLHIFCNLSQEMVSFDKKRNMCGDNVVILNVQNVKIQKQKCQKEGGMLVGEETTNFV